MASNNMYRVGDFVFFETSAGAPYQIRKIEELNKTATGAVEAKVSCFYRRRDLSNSLLLSADKLMKGDLSSSTEEDQHLIKHRELFITRQLETLPATHIRGKAFVTQFNDNESFTSYINSENTFFYNLIYDTAEKKVFSGRNSIKISYMRQAHIPPLLSIGTRETEKEIVREKLLWIPDNKMSEEDINNFVTVCRSLGTYARACDVASSVRQPNLAAAAAAASRDITLAEAHNRLHEADYDLQTALITLAPKGGPAIVRDQMEHWSASEGALLEQGLRKYGKHFHALCNDFLPWKSTNQLIEFYYMWKTSQHYLQLKRLRHVENEHKLKQVYIPNYTKPNPAVLFNGSVSSGCGGCESCGSGSSLQWFAWGPPNLHCKLCDSCWNYWKRYGGLKNPTRPDHQHPLQRPSSPLPPSGGTMLNKSITSLSYQCPQLGCDKQFRQAPHLHSHVSSAHPHLLESLNHIDQNNPFGYEEFKNQKNGFFLHTSSDFKLARRFFSYKLRPNFRLARCFEKAGRNRLAANCVSKAALKSDFFECLKLPQNLWQKKVSPKDFGSLNKVIEKRNGGGGRKLS